MKGEIRINLATRITELEQQTGNRQETAQGREHEATIVTTPQQTLQSVLNALREDISEVSVGPQPDPNKRWR